MKNYNLLDSSVYLLGLNKLYSYCRGLLTRKDIEKILFKFETYSLNQNERISEKTNKHFVYGLRDVWEVDSIYIQSLSDYNDGFKFIFCAIDTFSKRLWRHPIHSTSGDEGISALQIIFQVCGSLPKNFKSDKGSEVS